MKIVTETLPALEFEAGMATSDADGTNNGVKTVVETIIAIGLQIAV